MMMNTSRGRRRKRSLSTVQTPLLTTGESLLMQDPRFAEKLMRLKETAKRNKLAAAAAAERQNQPPAIAERQNQPPSVEDDIKKAVEAFKILWQLPEFRCHYTIDDKTLQSRYVFKNGNWLKEGIRKVGKYKFTIPKTLDGVAKVFEHSLRCSWGLKSPDNPKKKRKKSLSKSKTAIKKRNQRKKVLEKQSERSELPSVSELSSESERSELSSEEESSSSSYDDDESSNQMSGQYPKVYNRNKRCHPSSSSSSSSQEPTTISSSSGSRSPSPSPDEPQRKKRKLTQRSPSPPPLTPESTIIMTPNGLAWNDLPLPPPRPTSDLILTWRERAALQYPGLVDPYVPKILSSPPRSPGCSPPRRILSEDYDDDDVVSFSCSKEDEELVLQPQPQPQPKPISYTPNSQLSSVSPPQRNLRSPPLKK